MLALFLAAFFIEGGELFFAQEKAGEQFFFDPVKAGLESVVLIDASDFGFDGSGVALEAEEIVGGEADKGLAVETASVGEKPFAHIKRQDRIANPGFLALFGQRSFIHLHELLLGSWASILERSFCSERWSQKPLSSSIKMEE